MSHRHHRHHHGIHGNYGFLNPYTLIILILIVLQWFRSGNAADGTAAPESGLVSNGGLFIITFFLLMYCSCGMILGEKKCCR